MNIYKKPIHLLVKLIKFNSTKKLFEEFLKHLLIKHLFFVSYQILSFIFLSIYLPRRHNVL